MHQIRFRLGLCPRPRWGSLQRSPRQRSLRPPDILAEFKGPTSKDREGRERRGRGGKRRGGKEREEGRGGKEVERKGRGRGTWGRDVAPQTSRPNCAHGYA